VIKWNKLLRGVVRSPFVWGVLASVWFYKMIDSGALSGETIERYFASHPVEYAATTMFLIALAALVIKAVDMVGQYAALAEPVLGPVSRTGRSAEDCDAMLRRLDQLPSRRQDDYLTRRLREAVEHVRRRGAADTLDEHLKYLADLDAERLHSGYALVRVIIWAIPILGFLGTVIGITMAIANLSPGAVEDSLPQVITGLSVAFATTTQALVLSIVLMFAQYFTSQKENALLAEVDARAAAQLQGRFEQIPDGPDGQLLAVRRMAETVVEVTERLVERQVELWQASMQAAEKRWAGLADATGEQVQKVLSGALSESLKAHAEQLGTAERSIAQQNHQHWHQVQQTQVQNTQAMAALQAAIAKQAEVFHRTLQAVGEVTRLEDTLNRNLAALAGAKNFEQTVMSLAAAIHLLNARLTDGPAPAAQIQLQGNKSTQAA